MPIYKGMWHYRPGWENEVTPLAETVAGDNSTVYRFGLCSHTGTYVETSQHKLANNILLDDFKLTDLVCTCKVLCLASGQPGKEVTLDEFQSAMDQSGLSVNAGDSLLIATGWGMNHAASDYLDACPYFSRRLVEWLCQTRLHLLGVDVPIIDHPITPFGAVKNLFMSNPRLLLIAPLVIDLAVVTSGTYLLVAAPLNIQGVSASLCRPLLIEL
ncbi:cyclase family protein [Stieleria maiorica]|nr:cyclase family protein [Stieleria maiorica]